MKNIQLKVVKIKYSGGSVGNDITIEVSCLDGNLNLKKNIKNKSEVKTDAIVGEFVTDQKSFTLPVNIKIIERDILFNDIGGKKIDLNVDLDNYLTQLSTHEILVKELRSPSSRGGRTGIFEVTLEILVLENIFYIPITNVGNKTYLTTDSPSAPWTEGLYDIEIPDYPHEGGLHYKGSKYARAWFRIGHGGDKYLHTGAHSLGCMTVVEVDKWDEILGF